MTTFAVGDDVLVPAAASGDTGNGPALRERKVLQLVDRSVLVNGPPDQPACKVGVARVHKDFGLVLVRIGDVASDPELLDPLANSLEHYFRLLLPPGDRFWVWRIRTQAELEEYWKAFQGVVTHVVLAGHGSPTSMKFLDKGWVTGAALGAALMAAVPDGTAKEFVSLACQTGHMPFARGLSSAACCASLTAPFQAVHGVVAMQYAETYFSTLLVEGASAGNARRRAQAALPHGNHFRLWRNGKLQTGTDSPEPTGKAAPAAVGP